MCECAFVNWLVWIGNAVRIKPTVIQIWHGNWKTVLREPSQYSEYVYFVYTTEDTSQTQRTMQPDQRPFMPSYMYMKHRSIYKNGWKKNKHQYAHINRKKISADTLIGAGCRSFILQIDFVSNTPCCDCMLMACNQLGFLLDFKLVSPNGSSNECEQFFHDNWPFLRLIAQHEI